MLLKCNLLLAMLYLFIGCYKQTAGEAFYIIPSPSSSHCPQQHCFTLTQLLSNATRNLSSSVTLYFLPGTHSLSSEHVFGNISELHLLSLSDFPLEAARISCGPTARMLFENVHLVQVSHLYFVGCRENKIESVNQLIVKNSTFRGLQGTYGTALELVHTNAEIINSSFLFNQYGSFRGPLGLLEFLIKKQKIPALSVYALVGGALIVNCSNISVTGSRFEGNVAEIGGAIFIEGPNSNVTLTSCILINNTALSSSLLGFGGAIFSENGSTRGSTTLVNTKFINNRALAEGGAIVAFFIRVEIFGCTFTSNYALLGGVLTVIKSNTTVYDSNFNLNDAYSAGVIFANSETDINITKSQFSSNTVRHTHSAGGVLLVSELTHMTITESTFYNNSAQVEGGVIYMTSVCNLIILRCQFSNNEAYKGGVVTAKFQSSVTILDSDFNNNTAYEGGGVVSIHDEATLHVTNSSFRDCTANVGGVLMQERNTSAIVSNCTFHCNFATVAGGVFFSQNTSQITLIGCDFIDNRAVLGGVGMVQSQCDVSIKDCSAFNNVASHLGGAVFAIDECFVYIERCQFNDCKASSLERFNASGGVFVVAHSSILTMKECEIYNNTAQHGGGVVFVSDYSSVYINNTQFSFNLAPRGGVIHFTDQANATITNCTFSENSGTRGGTIDLVTGSALSLVQTLFINNDGLMGGAIFTDKEAIALIKESTFIGNKGFLGGTILIFNSQGVALINTLISESIASLGLVYAIEATIYFQNVTITRNIGTVQVVRGATLYLIGNVIFENNIMSNLTINIDAALAEGGALTVYRSGVTIVDNTTAYFYNNTAEKGAAIHATDSNVHIGIGGNVTIANNTARYNGGGLYLYQSEITCGSILRLIGNCAFNSGGGIYAVSSTVDIVSPNRKQPSLLFFENSAQVGGGLYVEANAKFYISKPEYQINETRASYTAVFSHNFADFADYGGAIAVEDGTNFGVCDSNPYVIQTSSLNQKHAHYAECFLQVINLNGLNQTDFNLHYASDSINFTRNYALYAGSSLFGGLLDRCVVSSPANASNAIPTEKTLYNGISYLKQVSNLEEDKVSSHPVKVCFCKNSQPDCSYKLPMKQLKKGENFTVALVAVDQVNHTISNTTIRAYLTFVASGFGEGQLIQKTRDSCTDLTYSVTTIHDYERIVVYAEGPCRDSSISKNRIDIEFIPCSCPIGFQQKDTENTNCVCICDSVLLPYVSSCNAQEEMVTKSNDAWISYVNQTLNSSGYLIHDHCPFDYCLSSLNSDHEIKVNLNKKNGADAQCANNHMGILCGACKSGFSLSLGSSHCIPCSHWHTNLPVILSTAIVSGVILVAVLLVLNLTVAIGTLNGVIFYANIVASNFSIFFPFTSPNFVTIFISWLNLDIGLDICFFEGMDAYWKLWIDILFPAYFIILVVMIIFVSERSTRFARLIGRKNPVATLATLILLSYTKLLRTIILSFSFAALNYPDDSVQLVWLPDGTVKYLNGKHIALFIVALVIVIAGVVYTLLLFFWQWILLYQNKFLFKWANNQRLNHFLDPYHAPYVYAYRYWTGLLLLIRAALYIIAAVNVSNDPGINLLATGFAVVSILVLKGCLKRNTIYRKWPLELIEIISYVNLIFFCLMSFYLLDNKAKQRIVAYISGSITLALFIIILFYHVLFELILKLLKRSIPANLGGVTQTDIEDNTDDQTTLIAPTYTIIEAPTPGELPLSFLVEAKEKIERNEKPSDHETELTELTEL